MQKKANQQKKYYFSNRLKKQLSQIPCHPLTIVEAPSGFGKTTAVREYLKKNLHPGACEYWYTCLGEPDSVAWEGICELLANVNVEKAESLKNLGMPTVDTLLYLTAILRNFYCQTEAYLVIDNFQLVKCDIPRELMSVFSMHGSPNLHMIFITQQLVAKQKISFHNANIHTIESSSLLFDREGIAGLFRMEGICLSGDELERVFMSTEGWISAIRLQITNFEENGSFDYTAGIEHLVEMAIWERLTPEEKDFLLSVSVMDSFTARQGAIMMDKETLPDKIEDMLKSNDFIRYFPDKGIYAIHSILQDYLRNRFCYYQSEDFQKRTLYRAGQSFVSVSQYYPAAQLFFKIKDFDAILSIPFNGEYLNNQKENLLPEFIAKLVEECPEGILCKYPFVMLMFSYPLLLDQQNEVFQKLCRLIGLSIEKNYMELSQEELRRLKGEFTLLMSFTAYNDIRRMSEGRKAALKILDGPSSIIVNNMPWTFGNISILSMFWRESGKLNDTLRDMEECLPYYLKLTRGHGTGADSAMWAEAMFMRGEDDEAEVLCYKALYGAGSHRQIGICLCAELVLAYIAILRGNAEAYFTSVKNIQRYSKENTSLYVLRMMDLCLTSISLLLYSTDNVAKWLRNTESIKKTLYAPAIPYAQSLYSKLLIIEKRYNEFYGISRYIMNTTENTSGNVRYILPQIYQLIYLAVAKRNNGRALEAQEHLKEALTLALPDQIYLPFAQQAGMADFITEVSTGTSTHCVADLIALCRRHEKGVGVIRKALIQAKSPLTPREREIAQLAKDRLSAREIAVKLYISEATVRTILKSVYSKLDIHSKTELNFREF